MSNRIKPRTTKGRYYTYTRKPAAVNDLVASLRDENARLRTERDELRALRDKQHTELVAAADLNRRVTANRDAWKATAEHASSRRNDLFEANNALKTATDEQRKALNNLTDQLRTAQAELKGVASARDTYKNAAEATSEDYERVCRELQQLKARPDQSRAIGNLQQEVATLRAQLDRALAEVAEHKDQRERIESDSGVVRAMLERARKQIADYQVRIDDAGRKYGDKCNEVTRLDRQLRAMTESARAVERERVTIATATTVHAQVLAELQRVQREVLAYVAQMRTKKIIIMNLYASRIEAVVLENMTEFPPEEQMTGCDCGPREGCPDCCDFNG